MSIQTSFWIGRRVLVTGHTGFKGGWLALWLQRLGAEVTGLALGPDTQPNLFALAKVTSGIVASHTIDIRNAQAVRDVVQSARPEVVFHLAAQSLVRRSYVQPLDTFSTNLMGTAHVLDALRDAPDAQVAIVVTTDKVYANREWHWPYREDDTLGGHDPYSASKAACELMVESYRKSFFDAKGVRVATARAGNVIGGGDWSPDRVLPDAVRAWQDGQALDVRRPNAVRPWQHVLEPLSAYLTLAQALWHGQAPAGAYNFGPALHDAVSVRQVVCLAQRAWGNGAEVYWGDGSSGPHEAGLLALEVTKARSVLGVTPRWDLNGAVGRTMSWYKKQIDGSNARELCLADIAAFEASESGVATALEASK